MPDGPRPQVIELSLRDRGMAGIGQVPTERMGKLLMGRSPAWDARRVQLGLMSAPPPELDPTYPPTGTDLKRFNYSTTPPVPELHLIINHTHAANRKADGAPMYAPGSRQALMAAARGEPSPTVGLSTKVGVGEVVDTGTTTPARRIQAHVLPAREAPFSLPEFPRRRFVPESTLRATTVPDGADSSRHSGEALVAKSVLYTTSDPVKKRLAELAATWSQQQTSRLFLKSPSSAIEAYVSSHPGIVAQVQTEEAERQAALRRERYMSPPTESLAERRKRRLKELGLTT